MRHFLFHPFLTTALRRAAQTILPCIALLLSAQAGADTIATVFSPDSSIVVNVSLGDKGAIYYNVQHGGRTLISDSRLGLRAANMNFTEGLTFTGCDTAAIDETYTLPVGKRSSYLNRCNEMTVHFRKTIRRFDVVVRAYDDGVALRYAISGGRGGYTVTADSTQVCFPGFQKCWAQEYIKTYEGHYNGRTWAQTAALPGQKMCAPVLVQTSGGNSDWALVTESDVTGTFCTSAMVADSLNKGRFRYSMAGNATIQMPFTSPWRTVFIGSLPTLVESTLNENLCPASTIDDVSWIRTGLSSWDWGSLDGNDAKDLSFIKRCIDYAVVEHWPYFTLDAGWDGAPYRLKDVTDYAARKGVKVFIWTHQNRFQTNKAQIREILRRWKDIGFAGIKVDFFESDEQSMMLKYQYLLEVAGEVGLMCNFHGATKPTGLRRTYPNLLSREGVFGGENYYWGGDVSAAHNINLALTRNVIGPMDYTPVEFASRAGVLRHRTTWSHQLALAVLYESGIQTMSESYNNLLPSVAAPMLRGMPASWDETKCIDASPDKYVTIMRRKGDDYYVASISSGARTIRLSLSFLGEGDYTAQIYRDGTCPSSIAYEEKTVNRSQTLLLAVKSSGGCSIRFTKTPHKQPFRITAEAENGTFQGNITRETDNTGNCSGGQYAGYVGNGNTVTNTVSVPAAGVYDMTIFYMTMDDRNMFVQVNGGAQKTYAFTGKGSSWGGSGLAMKTVKVLLRKGSNTITYGYGAGGYCPNVDRIELTPSADYQSLTVARILAPAQTTGHFSAAETVRARFTGGDTDLKNVKVSYQTDYGERVVDSIPLLSAGDTVDYEFSRKADLSAAANHSLLVWIEPDSTRGIVGDMASAQLTTLPPADEKAVSWASEGGKVGGSSYYSASAPASNLIDNNEATGWTDGSSSAPWVTISLPQTYRVTRLVMRDGASAGSGRNTDHYTVYVRPDTKSTWTEVLDTYYREGDTVKVDNLTPVNAQQVRVVFARPLDGSALSLYSIDIYGDTALINAIHSVTVPASRASERVNVYTPDGAMVRSGVPAARALDGLGRGVYIVGERKVIVR